MVILGFLLMVMCYTVPTENAHDTVIENAPFMEKKYDAIPFYNSTKYDVFSDAVYLSEVSFYNKNVSLVENAMNVYGAKDLTNFQTYASGDESVMGGYPRYWHGNLVILKPLFYFLDYSAVKVLELFFELVMFVIIVKLMIENNLKDYIIPFLFSIFLIHPEVIGINLQYWILFNIMLISVAVLLKFKEKLFKNNRLLYYFLIVGMSTNFLDILTFPLVTFGVPMIFCILLDDDSSLKENLLKIISFGLIWIVGYAGMWVSKWIISSVLLNADVIGDALRKIFIRTSTVEYTRVDAILENLLVYKKKSYLIIFALIGVYYIRKLIPVIKNISRLDLNRVIPFMIMAILPFGWFFILSNHSYIHAFFTYRILLIFFFAIFCSLEYLCAKKIDSKECHESEC